MFTYNISKNAEQKAFSDTCALIESEFNDITKEKLLEDADGTQIQIYNTPEGKIKVFNDYEVDAVYVDSEIKLNKII